MSSQPSAPAPRMTPPTRMILSYLAEHDDEDLWGLRIIGMTDLGPGTVYPLLGRLEEAGLVSARWEEVNPADVGRPRRKFWSLTYAGQMKARSVKTSRKETRS